MNFKTVMMTSLLLSSLQVCFAQSTAPGENFSVMKQKIVANIEERLNALNQTKACVSAAQDKEALKNCRDQAKSSREKFKDTLKANRNQNLDKKIQKLQEKKNKN